MTMRDFSVHPNALILQGNNRERWQMDHHQDNPFFFVIIKNTKQLKVPKKFLKYLNEGLSSNAILIGPSGDQWQVTILKKGNGMYLQNGWPQFLTSNSVILDEFLLFTYHVGNCFHVQIFGKNGCERLFLKETRQEQAATPSLARTKKSTQRKTSAGSFLHESKSCQKDLPFINKGTLSNGCEIKKTRLEQAATPSLERTKRSRQTKTSASSSHLHKSKTCQEDLPFSNKGSLSNECERLCLKKPKQEQAATPSVVRKNKNSAGSSHLHESKSCQEDLPFSNKVSLSKEFPKPQISVKVESSEACKLASLLPLAILIGSTS
ncbi:hypothetical protein E2542_SST10386 [Spatholobus suberectus]|nr:hypothetical protein E2542_SST10386 [Spatholobus suberectus]